MDKYKYKNNINIKNSIKIGKAMKNNNWPAVCKKAK